MTPRLTQSGYRLSEVVSALQKEIRHGKERDAMFWALELIPRYEHYLWRRLLVIVNEDIGLANVNAIRMVPEFRRQYFEFRAYRRECLPLANCILMMCRSPKARLADEFLACTLYERAMGLELNIPEYALDKYTLKGRQAGRGFDHWFMEGCALYPPTAEEFLTYREEAYQRWKAEETKVGISSFDVNDIPEPEDLEPSPLFGKPAPRSREDSASGGVAGKPERKGD